MSRGYLGEEENCFSRNLVVSARQENAKRKKKNKIPIVSDRIIISKELYRKTFKDRKIDKKRERKREKKEECVCERERKRERERKSMCVRERERKRERACV